LLSKSSQLEIEPYGKDENQENADPDRDKGNNHTLSIGVIEASPN
jgi:hypothetical protein